MAFPLAPPPLASPPAPMLSRRRRGGQPGNRNAFCRGMVSARHPSSLAVVSALSMLLIGCSYHEHGIPCDAGSFRGKINKSDLKSSHPSGFFYPSWRNPLARTPRVARGRSSNPSSPCARRLFAGGRSPAPPPGLPARGAGPSSLIRSSFVPQEQIPRTLTSKYRFRNEFKCACDHIRRGTSQFPTPDPFLSLANPPALGYPYRREWLGPGGLPGLQNRRRVALRAAVGSTPIHSRLFFVGHHSSLVTRHSSLVTRHSSIVNRKS